MRNSVGDYAAFNPKWQRWRESGFVPPIGSEDEFAKSVYGSMTHCGQWDSPPEERSTRHGGVFNLEFSPDGSSLVAACEKMSIVVFDPLTHKTTHFVKDAHTDCVNCVKFINHYQFATCSDDTTIALWDLRNLKTFTRSLQGHSNWVKNIEYSEKDRLLVTSGLDGSVYTWDINAYTERSFVHQRVFNTAGLMRCRISPDAGRLVMCTTGGLIIVIHDLDLNALAQDLLGFKPSIYRLMLATGQRIPIAVNYSHLFDAKRKRNRVEIISDFPEDNDAEVVSSLQIHPQGWCALSRNISQDDGSEYTCVHDIQGNHDSDEEEGEDDRKKKVKGNNSGGTRTGGACTHRMPLRSSVRTRSRAAASNDDGSAQSGTGSERPSAIVGHNDVWEALITVRQRRQRFASALRGGSGRNFNNQRISGISTGIPYDDRPLPAAEPDNGSVPAYIFNMSFQQSPSRVPNHRRFVSMNENSKKRLLFYTKEPNLGKGFIKELCFSSDGRLICSPFGYGARLLGFSKSCSEIFACLPEPGKAKELVELGQNIRHEDLVVSSKFSPRHYLLVTGCLGGRIVWYQPRG